MSALKVILSTHNIFFGWEMIFFFNLIALYTLLYGPRRKKTCLWWFANNTGTDQPAHPHSLISAFVIRFLESTISKLATSEISIF